jgi:tetratricopeptide (TPR) repeat protein
MGEIIKKLEGHLKHPDLTSYTFEERKLLGKLLLLKAEKKLAQKLFQEAFGIFLEIKKMGEKYFSLLYKTGQLLAQFKENVSFLKLACSFFELALEAHPGSFNAWHALAMTKVQLGICIHEEIFFIEALEVFKKVEVLLKNRDQKTQCSFYRHRGICFYFLGLLTEEPLEFSRSLHEYDKAYILGQNSPSFWNDYGNSCVELSILINDLNLLDKAIGAFWKCTKDPFLGPCGWQNLAYSYHTLYQKTALDAHFTASDTCYKKAVSLNQDHFYLWLRWAVLFSSKGREEESIYFLKCAEDKFKIADTINPDSAQILLNFAENDLYLGRLLNNEVPLKNAIRRVQRSLLLRKENPKAWFFLASAFFELGALKKAPKYLERAILKFKKALLLDPKNPSFWKGIASSKIEIFYILLDSKKNATRFLEEGLKIFSYLEGVLIDPSVEFILEWTDALIVDYETFHNISSLKEAQKKQEKYLKKTSFSSSIEFLLSYGYSLELLFEEYNNADYLYDAIASYEKALRVDCHCLEAYISLGQVLLMIGYAESCIKTFQKALENFQKALSIDSSLSECWAGCGVCLLEIGIYYEGSQATKKAFYYLFESERCLLQAENYNDTTVYFSLACLYAKLLEEDKALKYLNITLSKDLGLSLNEIINHPHLEYLRDKSKFWSLIKEIYGY